VDVVDQYLENGRKHDIEPLEALKCEVDLAGGIELELHPSYTPGLRRADNLYVDYKLHERRARVDRIFNLLVCETEYVRDSHGRWSFYPEVAKQIRFEILNFWNGERTDSTCTMYIPGPR
jgi:hypothetical protein